MNIKNELTQVCNLQANGSSVLANQNAHFPKAMLLAKYSGQHNQCNICGARDGKVGCNNFEHTTAFLYVDWLYLLWYEMKNMLQNSFYFLEPQLHVPFMLRLVYKPHTQLISMTLEK